MVLRKHRRHLDGCQGHVHCTLAMQHLLGLRPGIPHIHAQKAPLASLGCREAPVPRWAVGLPSCLAQALRSIGQPSVAIKPRRWQARHHLQVRGILVCCEIAHLSRGMIRARKLACIAAWQARAQAGWLEFMPAGHPTWPHPSSPPAKPSREHLQACIHAMRPIS